MEKAPKKISKEPSAKSSLPQPGAERPFFGSKQFSSQIIATRHFSGFWSKSKRILQFFFDFTKSLLKLLNLPFIIYLIDAISFKMFLVRQKYICFQKQKCFWWETTNDKKIWIWKVENSKPWYLPFWKIFNFSNSICFCHFWFPIKKIFFSQSKHTFMLPKTFLGW